MYTITKRLEISGAHHLDLPYESKCQNVHGHNWIVTVTLQAEELNKNDMVLDFNEIKNIVNEFDHADINEVLPRNMNPTAENMARYLCELIPFCVRVSVQETEGNVATYER